MVQLPESLTVEKKLSESLSESLSSSFSSISRYFDSFTGIKDGETIVKDAPSIKGRDKRRLQYMGQKCSEQSKADLLVDESETLSGSFSSISRYFDSFAASKDEEAFRVKDAPSIEGGDKRHLLLIGQKPSEQTQAEIVLSDKREWRKLQQRIKKSGMITNEGTRQILNPLLEKTQMHSKDDTNQELPPFILIPEPTHIVKI
jgi:hypothetical protein